MKLQSLMIIAGTAIAVAGCSGGAKSETEVTPPQPVKKEIKISTTVVSRATDTAFETGDRAGLYVVNRSGAVAPDLATQGNHVDNAMFTFNGTWTTATPLYWADDKTNADFYLYYPYTSTVASVTSLPFKLKADQSTAAGYKACDFMAGRSLNVAPTGNAVAITVNHLMSQTKIKLTTGNGFTPEGLAAANPQVKINNVLTDTRINLANLTVTAQGDAESVLPLEDGGIWKALVAPQTIAECKLITVTVDGKDYNLTKGVTLATGKSYTFTITLSKTSAGINVSIGSWDDDGSDFGGVAE